MNQDTCSTSSQDMCFRFCIPSVSLSSGTKDVGSVDNLIDDILNHIRLNRKEKAKIDPLHVPDIQEGVTSASNIWIEGLSSLSRSGNFAISTSNDGNKIEVVGNVVPKAILICLHYSSEQFWWVSGKVRGKLSTMEIRARFSIESNALIATLEEFKVVQLGDVNREKITSFRNRLSFVFYETAEKALKLSKQMVAEAIESKVANLTKENLEKITFPLIRV